MDQLVGIGRAYIAFSQEFPVYVEVMARCELLSPEPDAAPGPLASVTPMPAQSFTVPCPCCDAKLTIDPELGVVIAHEAPPPKRTVGDLGAAFDVMKSKSAEREERFRAQMQAEAQKGKVLDRKFQEGLKKAKDSPDPPKRPFDYE